MAIESMIWLIPLLPVLAFFIIVLFTYRSHILSHTLALIAAGFSWLSAMVVFFRAVNTPDLNSNPFTSVVNWLPIGSGWFKIGFHLDALSAVTLFFVAWTVLMIFIYSVGYHNFGQPSGDDDLPGLPPHGVTVKDAHGHAHRVPSVEPMYSRFFAFISLFAFGMFTLVLTDNLLTLYMGWEIMGLCSYLLIGFWYAKPSARDAAVKAFITTRIGDVFMLLGLAALYTLTGTLNYQEILFDQQVLMKLAETPAPLFNMSWAGFIGLLLFIGAVGKSSQFPLHVWLPDAMEGPTPVSAMIHAAAMVSAGVYMVIRFFPLISAGWEQGQPLPPTMMVMAAIGTFTALFAATIAVAQNDIKRVLAYSTISQLGYMIAALGVGAYVAAAFHLVTHAFFKALLFMGSGSVIHGMEHGVLHTNEDIDAQDMFNMGGLREKMPVTFWTFLAGGLALSGFPFITAGFFSKDEILSGAFSSGQFWVFIALAIAALLTAFYTMRQICLTFLGKPRTKSAEHAHESRFSMTFPLIVLAFFAITFGWVGVAEEFPLVGGVLPHWFQDFFGGMLVGHGEHHAGAHSLIPLFSSLIVALGGLFLGWLVYKNVKEGDIDPLQKPLGFVYTILKNKYYIDEFYQLVFIRPAIWLADVFVSRWIDKRLLDGILHGIARFTLWMGRAIRNYFDLPVINGLGDQLSQGTRQVGGVMRDVQTGRVQRYMLAAMMVVLIVSALFYYLFILA